MEEVDPVVCEIPVHLTEELRGNIHMIQFPLRPSYRPMSYAPKTARVKPENQILQLDYEVDQKSEHFDKDAEDYLKQKTLRLQSSMVPHLSNYVVGVFRQGQLHLTPVSSILQMRPSLAYIDDAVEDEMEDMEAQIEKERSQQSTEMKEVQFQFKKKQSERAMNAIQNSYAFKKQQINAESWRELHVFDPNTGAAQDEFEHLFSEREEEVMLEVSRSEYLKTLRYRDLVTSHQSKVEDDEQLENMKIEGALDQKNQQVLSALKTDKIHTFDSLEAVLPSNTHEDINKALQLVAVSSNGRLLPKSVQVCSTDEEAKTRDILIAELTKNTSISRMTVVNKYGIDADTTKRLLEDFAVLDPDSRMWSFKISDDDHFARRFPETSKLISIKTKK